MLESLDSMAQQHQIHNLVFGLILIAQHTSNVLIPSLYIRLTFNAGLRTHFRFLTTWAVTDMSSTLGKFKKSNWERIS